MITKNTLQWKSISSWFFFKFNDSATWKVNQRWGCLLVLRLLYSIYSVRQRRFLLIFERKLKSLVQKYSRFSKSWPWKIRSIYILASTPWAPIYFFKNTLASSHKMHVNWTVILIHFSTHNNFNIALEPKEMSMSNPSLNQGKRKKNEKCPKM